MNSLPLDPAQIPQVSALTAGYISTQRQKYLRRSVALSAAQKAAMAGFFSSELLDFVRILELQGERVADPDFYPMLTSLGFKNLPKQSDMAAITLLDVVVSHGPFSNGVLFHELVHVEQYRQLGTLRFAELYVRGFLSGGGYEAIPLEVNAYSLGGRFESNPGQIFSVRNEVARWIAEGRF